jgi:hypothetical protein
MKKEKKYYYLKVGDVIKEGDECEFVWLHNKTIWRPRGKESFGKTLAQDWLRTRRIQKIYNKFDSNKKPRWE